MEGIVLLIVPIGVLAAIGLTWLCGGWVDARIADAEEAGERLRELEPGFEVAEVCLAEGGAGAIVAGRYDQRPAIAVLFANGDELVSRVLHAADLRGVELGEEGGLLRIHTRDFTSPVIDLRLDPAEADGWRRRLAGGEAAHG